MSFEWNSAAPADADLVSSGASEIRSERTNLQKVLNAEHFFPEGGVSGGAHRAGSARAYFGTTSQVSSTDTSGRLMVTSDRSDLWYVGSQGTYKLGGRLVPHGPVGAGEIGTNLSLQTQFVGIDAGNVAIGLNKTLIVLNHTFVRAPAIACSISQVDISGEKIFAPEVELAGTSSFTVNWEGSSGGGASSATLSYIAVGRVALP